MNREEQIIGAAKALNATTGWSFGFIEGAQWADAHPKEETLNAKIRNKLGPFQTLLDLASIFLEEKGDIETVKKLLEETIPIAKKSMLFLANLDDSKENGVEMWVARDNTIYQDCNLHLFIKEPILEEIDKCEWESKDCTPKLHLNSKLFPEVTFENSPQRVRLTLVKGGK